LAQVVGPPDTKLFTDAMKMVRWTPGVCQHLLTQALRVLLLEAFLSAAGHPALPPCNGEHRLASESCTTSGRQSLLQVARSSSMKASQGVQQIPSEAEAFYSSSEGGDTIVDEALASLEANNVASTMGELKDVVSASEFVNENEGLTLEKSSDNPVALQNPSSTLLDESHGNASSGSAEQPGNVSSCTPTCRWSCSSPVCEEECEPLCKPGNCETRCSTMDLAGCMLGCEQPECATICPKNHCAKPGCPKCITKCSQPLCKLRCPQEQNCTSVCESPSCKWQCQKPQRCPEPECKLECESQRKECKKSVHAKLPELEKGEIKVASFVPPSSLLQMSHGQLTPPGNGDHRIKALHLGAIVESMDGEEISRFVVEFPLAS